MKLFLKRSMPWYLLSRVFNPPNGGVAALRRFAGTVASLAQEKNLRLAFISVEKKCRTL
jgi:hypothetical protein